MSPRWGSSFSLGRLGPGKTSPITWIFEEAKVLKVKVKFPLHWSPPKQIVPAKQPIMKCRPKEEHLPRTKQQQTNICKL
jgi:hypothetical protein